MSKSQQVKIGREFFTKIKMDYADWQWAIIREFLQNSFDAPGCNRVEVTIKAGEGKRTILRVENNGAPMDRDTLENKLLTLGGSGKNFEGENTGGFGVAKSLLYYCHRSYLIRTGALLVEGEGASYTIQEDGTAFAGTMSSVELDGDHQQRLIEMVRRFAMFAQWKGKLTVNDEELVCNLHKGARRKDLGWGVVYTNNSFSNVCLVRLNGQPMFTRYTRFKGCVLVELTGKAFETLTSNRDALKAKLDSELSDLLTALAVDKKSALREQKAEYKRFQGEKQKNEAKKPKAAEGGLNEIADAGQLAALIKTTLGGRGTPQTEVVPPTTEGAGGIRLAVESTEEMPVSISVGPEFIIKNTTGMKTPARYLPNEEFSDSSRGLVLAWTAILLKMHQLCNVSGEFSVGFVFDDESEAEFEQGPYGKVYYLNPALLSKTEAGRRCLENRFTNAFTDRHTLIGLAAHEFVHGAYGYGEHDEDYAGKLTDVMVLCFKHAAELEACCRIPKVESDEPRGRKEHDKVYGHSVSAIVRWMGAQGWRFEQARNAFDSMGMTSVADGTIKTFLQAGRHGQRGEPAALTAQQVTELTEASY